MALDTSETRWHVLGLLDALRHLGTTLASVIEEQASHAVARYRMELRRVTSVLALSLVGALLAFASIVCMALAAMLAFWNTHPVAASASIAVAFALLALVAALLVRQRTRVVPPSPRD